LLRSTGHQRWPSPEPVWPAAPIDLWLGAKGVAQLAVVLGVVLLIREHSPDAGHDREGGQKLRFWAALPSLPENQICGLIQDPVRLTTRPPTASVVRVVSE
jgi:hypothetical protein